LEIDRETIRGLAEVTLALVLFTDAAGADMRVLRKSVLSLTVIRILPVFLSLAGSGIDTEGKLFIGWFGPRGLASIVFAVIVINSGLPDSGPLAMTVTCTIILSIIAHGITANPWARAYGERRRLAGQHE
jgi:NhaP-type Na+/H+ or K+/H+ antiporter